MNIINKFLRFARSCDRSFQKHYPFQVFNEQIEDCTISGFASNPQDDEDIWIEVLVGFDDYSNHLAHLHQRDLGRLIRVLSSYREYRTDPENRKAPAWLKEGLE